PNPLKNWPLRKKIDPRIYNFIFSLLHYCSMPHIFLSPPTVTGRCYGQENQPDKGDYLKLCGQIFWEFISGNDRLFVDIVEPLGYRAKERNDEFLMEYSRILNLFTQEFMDGFCVSGRIDWNKLVQFNSGRN
ncbi:MAG: PmeII family type II restriction endonuclease, partial [Chloroflexota bacterium]